MGKQRAGWRLVTTKEGIEEEEAKGLAGSNHHV
jgi:hypothetical protein